MAPSPPGPAGHDEPPPARPRRLRKVAIALGGLLIAALTLLVFAPQLLSGVAKSQVLALAAGKIDGKLEVDSLELGWFRHVALGGVRVTDPEGRPVAEVERVGLDRTLFALALSRTDLGTLTVERPVVHVVTEGSTTNVERVFHKLMEPPEQSGGARPDITVVVRDGRVTMTDAANPAGAQSLERLQAEVTVPPDDSRPISVKLDADSGAGGHLAATAEAGAETTARLKAVGFPLSTLAPLLARFRPGLSAEGVLDADATIDQVAATNTAKLGGTVRLTGLAVGGAGLPQPVKMRSLTVLPGGATLAGRELTLVGTRIDCDAGHLSATAKVSLDKPVAELLTTSGLDLDLDLDLAQLAAAAPALVPVRAGTELKEGRVNASLKSSTGDKGTGWKGNFTLSPLKGVRAGKPISWEKPLKLEFDGHLRAADQLPVFENLKCEADFVGLAARGSPEQFLVLANLDLDRISARVGDFIDLGGRTLGGTGSLSLTRAPKPDHGFDIKFALKMKEVRYADPAAGHSLAEPALDVAGSASGRHKPGETVRLDAAGAEMTTGADRLTVQLAGPVPSLKSMADAQFRVGFDGELAPWYRRAGQLTALPANLSVAGRGPASATVRLTPTEVVARDIRANFANLRVTRGSVVLAEPTFELAASATYGREGGAIRCQDVAVKSQTVTLDAPRLDVTFPPTGVAVKTDAKLSADLARLDRAFTGTADRVGGKLAGTVKLDPGPGGQTAFSADLKVANAAYGSPAKPTWVEPWVSVTTSGSYDPAASRLDLPRLTVEKPGLAIDGRAALAQLSTLVALESAGTLRYDLAKLEPQLQGFIGPTFHASGAGQKPYSLRTNLGAPDMLAATEAKFAVGWDSLSAYGLKLDPAEFTATAAKGVVVGSPITAGFGGGVVRAEPTLSLAAPGMPLTLKPGRLIDKAKLTPELCSSALGFALPAFANAGQAAGQISLDVAEGNSIPLSDYRKGNVKGVLTVHDATVSAGPMIGKLAEVLGADKTTMTLAQEEKVPVRFENGRVYHENFGVRLGGTPVKTTGSVGLDKSLDLTAETPYPAQLLNGPLANNPRIQQALRERNMRVPVKGTLTAPQLDANAIRQNVQQAATSIAKEVGVGAVKGEAEKLKGKLLEGLQKKLGGGN